MWDVHQGNLYTLVYPAEERDCMGLWKQQDHRIRATRTHWGTNATTTSPDAGHGATGLCVYTVRDWSCFGPVFIYHALSNWKIYVTTCHMYVVFCYFTFIEAHGYVCLVFRKRPWAFEVLILLNYRNYWNWSEWIFHYEFITPLESTNSPSERVMTLWDPSWSMID